MEKLVLPILLLFAISLNGQVPGSSEDDFIFHSEILTDSNEFIQKAITSYNHGEYSECRYYLKKRHTQGHLTGSYFYLLGLWHYDVYENKNLAKRYWNSYGYLRYNSIPCKDLYEKLVIGEKINTKQIPKVDLNENEDLKEGKSYKGWLNAISDESFGRIYKVNDSSLVFMKGFGHAKLKSEISYTKINLITLKKKPGSLLVSMLTGLVIGAGLGAGLTAILVPSDGLTTNHALGNGTPTKSPQGDWVVLGGLLGGLSGIGIATLVRNPHIYIRINGKKDKFDKEKERLRKYSFLYLNSSNK